jgi:uncharacterized protein YneF (UPF0154 family)
MDATMNDYSKNPHLDVIALRDMMQQKGIKHQDAEAIAIAIDAKAQSQDTSNFATKGDIRELEQRLILKIENFKLSIIIWILGGTFAINNLPNAMNFILKIMGK